MNEETGVIGEKPLVKFRSSEQGWSSGDRQVAVHQCGHGSILD